MQAIQLPERCNRAAAIALYPELNDAANGEGPVPIDASKVEQIGQAMLQILAAAASSENGIELNSTSDAFNDAIALAKMGDILTKSETA